jgi:outer membrane protein OmpA-like peptidoglycan-associated protein
MLLPRRHCEIQGRHDRWLISYVDIVTILLILFAALAAQAVQRGHPPPAAASVTPPPPAHRIPSELRRARERLLREGLEVQWEERGLVIRLSQAVLFAAGQDHISAEALPVVAGIADVLRDLPNQVLLVGHADTSPIHNAHFRSNWELSAARSLRLLELLTVRFHIPEDRFSTAGQGSVKPSNPNATPAGRAANRRVEIVILQGG